MRRSFVREILEATTGETISFAGGLPDAGLFPLERLSEAAGRAMTRETLQYSVSGGIAPLRRLLADYYTGLGLPTQPEQILITTGAQQALDLMSRVYFREGAVVEAPAYLGAINAFEANGCPLHPVAVGSEGPDGAVFEAAFATTRRAYIMPDFQNPGGGLYATALRERIARIAVAHEGIIVEDGAYMELFFGERRPMIASDAPHHTLHVGSFSKILAPGLRVGWIRGDETLLRPIQALKERADLHTSTLTQTVIAEFWREGGFAGHLERIRDVYRHKCTILADALRELLPEFRFAMPQGGMFIYGRFEGDIDARALAYKALARGAVFVPGGEFYPGAPRSSEARWNFTHVDEAAARRGVGIVARAYREMRA